MRKPKPNGAGRDIKAYLSQAWDLDTRIRSKLLQLEDLNMLTVSCAAGMAEDLKKVTEMKDSAQYDLEKLIALKKEIVETIRTVENPTYQVLLEKRYLNSQCWEKIAADMGFNIRYIHKLHIEALKKIEICKTGHLRAEIGT